MNCLKHIAMLMLSISIAAAGIPAQAQSPCPMAAQMKMQHMDTKAMSDCDQMAKQQTQKRGGCCDDSACNAKCTAMGGSMNLPTVRADMPSFDADALRLSSADASIALRHLSTQERPPKSLA